MFPERPENNKSDDELDDLRQQLSSKSSMEYEDKRSDLSVSKNVFIGAISGVVLAGIVGWFVLSPKYSSNSVGDIPVIRRPQAAIKIQPADPGGMEILNQDKTVYDIIDKKGIEDASVEILLPPHEEPKLPVIAAEPEKPVETIGDIIDSTQVNKEISSAAASSDNTINQAKEIIAVETAPKKEPVQAVAATPKPAPIEEPTKEIRVVEAKPVNTVQIPRKVETAPEKIVASLPKAATSGSWQVQLMASTNKKAVAASWDGLVKKYPVLKNHSHEVETADLGAKGIFYRLQAGAFANRSGADSLCSEIKSLGGSCIVKKK